jgi:hypothetical protein
MMTLPEKSGGPGRNHQRYCPIQCISFELATLAHNPYIVKLTMIYTGCSESVRLPDQLQSYN